MHHVAVAVVPKRLVNTWRRVVQGSVITTVEGVASAPCTINLLRQVRRRSIEHHLVAMDVHRFLRMVIEAIMVIVLHVLVCTYVGVPVHRQL